MRARLTAALCGASLLAGVLGTSASAIAATIPAAGAARVRSGPPPGTPPATPSPPAPSPPAPLPPPPPSPVTPPPPAAAPEPAPPPPPAAAPRPPAAQPPPPAADPRAQRPERRPRPPATAAPPTHPLPPGELRPGAAACDWAAARRAVARARRSGRPAAGELLELLRATRASATCTPPPPTTSTRGRFADGVPRAPADRARRAVQPAPQAPAPAAPPGLPAATGVGMPSFFVERFGMPVFLLPIYRAAAAEYGVPWAILAAINEIETDYGRNLNVSSAGALGWMQFMPATWAAYGVDANRDGRKDPLNPVDAIFAAARYLRAAGADGDLRGALFAYNRADWYVASVLERARRIGGLPSSLLGALTALAQGRFPVHADASHRPAAERRGAGRAATRAPRSTDIQAAAGAPVIAVRDGHIAAAGSSRRRGRYVELVDDHGNRYAYGRLGAVAARVPALRPQVQSRAAIARELALARRDPRPARPATAGRPTTRPPASVAPARWHGLAPATAPPAIAKERLFAHPARPRSLRHGGARQLAEHAIAIPAGETLGSYLTGAVEIDARDVVLRPLVPGQRVVAGTVLGHLAAPPRGGTARMRFEIRPAGRHAPRIDPAPILDGWRLLEAAALQRAVAAAGGAQPSLGELLLMGEQELARRVLSDRRIEIYSCGRRDVAAGLVDRRVLVTLAALAADGLHPTVSSLRCGHHRLTSSGSVSAHTTGSAVDIAKINGIPVLGDQGAGSVTDRAIRRLLELNGAVRPHQIISLMGYDGADNALAMRDHADHIHVGFRPAVGPFAPPAGAELAPAHWRALMRTLGRIDNPEVATSASRYAIRAPARQRPHRRGRR